MGRMSHADPRPAEALAALDWSRAHHAEIQMRYGDLDAMGHLNNAVYVQYLETSRILLMRDLGVSEQDDRSVIARLELDYRHEVRWGQQVGVDSLIERVGRSSWTVVSRLTADGLPCAYARTVQVRVDAQHRPEALTEQMRAALTALYTLPPQPAGSVPG